ACEFLFMTDDDSILFRIDIENVKRPRVRDADPATLANRVAVDARVRSDYVAARCDDFSRTRQAVRLLLRFEIAIDKPGVVAVRDETDFLRFFLFRDCEIAAARGFAGIGL